MSTPNPYEGHPSEHRRPENQPRKVPEFIYLDEHLNPRRAVLGSAPPVKPKLKPVHATVKVRILCFLIGVVALAWAVGSLFGSALFGVISCVFFRQVNDLNRLTWQNWLGFKRALTIALGLFIAIFSPYLGFALILTYFMINEPMQSSTFTRLLQSQFKQFMG